MVTCRDRSGHGWRLFMAEETNDISGMTVIGMGIVLFIVIVGIWYLFLK